MIGGGHAQLGVLNALAREKVKLDAVLVTPGPYQVYSGMLPGWIAGHYRFEDCRIDLRPLAAEAGVELVSGEAVSMDANRKFVELHNGNRLAYDYLSIDVGGETDLSWLGAAGDQLLPIKPLSDFVQRWPDILAQAGRQDDYRMVVVGGGAAGVELVFAIHHVFAMHSIKASVTLVAAEHGILPGHASGVKQRAAALLKQRGIAVLQSRAVGAAGGVMLADGQLVRADCVLAATGSSAPAWLRTSGLVLDEHGYILVDGTHRSVSHPEVFAAGDVCTRTDTRLARSGVHAVFAGPVLGHNLLASLRGGRLQQYRPHRRTLYLLATGPQHAIASWGAFSAQGHWVWLWKRWIDRRFIRRQQR